VAVEWNDFSHPLTGRHNRYGTASAASSTAVFGSLTGTLGLRGDATDDFGFHPGVSTGLGWGVSAQWLLKAKAGYTVNVPTFEQLYQTGHGSIDQTRGNPNLQEERIWSYDVGVEYKTSKDRLLRATLFRNDTRDLISSRRGTDLIYRPVNINRAERQGSN
jgi:iron complex outermembrane receptor protein